MAATFGKIDETHVTVDHDAGRVEVRHRWNLGDQLVSLKWQGVELPAKDVIIEEVADAPLSPFAPRRPDNHQP